MKVTWLKKSSNLNQIGPFQTVTPVWIHRWRTLMIVVCLWAWTHLHPIHFWHNFFCIYRIVNIGVLMLLNILRFVRICNCFTGLFLMFWQINPAIYTNHQYSTSSETGKWFALCCALLWRSKNPSINIPQYYSTVIGKVHNRIVLVPVNQLRRI